jgi:RNA polymerase sigma factor (sigma-70 family)
MTFKQNVADEKACLADRESVLQACASASPKSTAGEQCVVLEEVWRNHWQQILRVTQRITNNREDAEDALQDSFLRAQVHLRSFDGRSSLLTWLTRIAINSALLILRKRVTAPQLSFDSADDSAAVSRLVLLDSSPSPETSYAEAERRELVRSEIAKLRPSIRRALELQTLEQWSLKDTAESLGLSIVATKSRIFQAKAALRKSLRPGSRRRLKKIHAPAASLT